MKLEEIKDDKGRTLKQGVVYTDEFNYVVIKQRGERVIGRYFPRIGSEPFEVDYTKRLGDCRTVPLRLVEETGLPSDAMTLANLLIREVGALKRAVKYADPSLKRAVKS